MNKIIRNYLIAHAALGLELRDTSNTKGVSNEEIDRLCAINSLIWAAQESLRDTAAANLAADVVLHVSSYTPIEVQ